MITRRNMAQTLPLAVVGLASGCYTSQADIVRLATAAATAAASIGHLIEVSHQEIGRRIVATADAVVVAAQQWALGTDTVSHVVSALNALKIILETLPYEMAQTVAVMIPIVLTAIERLFDLIPRTSGRDMADQSKVVFHPVEIPHHFLNSPVRDFIEAWNKAAVKCPGAVVFK